ncbi:unnamed protein product, partial [Ectocarpus sp. 8 AP-2014]
RAATLEDAPRESRRGWPGKRSATAAAANTEASRASQGSHRRRHGCRTSGCRFRRPRCPRRRTRPFHGVQAAAVAAAEHSPLRDRLRGCNDTDSAAACSTASDHGRRRRPAG